MIKYRPVRRTLSASIKEEQTFSTADDLIRFLFDRWTSVFAYCGSAPLTAEEIVIGETEGKNQQTGWTDERMIFVRDKCVGYCGE